MSRRALLELAGVLVGVGLLALVAFLVWPDSGSYEDAEPGRLVSAVPETEDVPEGVRAWRIEYTTSREGGESTTATGLVVVPESSGEHPVIAWAHGTTGIAEPCAPSLLGIGAGGWASLAPGMLEKGWAIVAPDYPGLGSEGPSPYVIGRGEAYSVLDAVRAARSVRGAGLSNETVAWGVSQGGHAALWSGTVAARYAPDVDLSGVVAMSAPTDLPAMADLLRDDPERIVFAAYLAVAYSEVYDLDLDDLIRPEALATVRDVAEQCVDAAEDPRAELEQKGVDSIWASDPTEGRMGELLAENVPEGPWGDVPVLLAQGEKDPLVTLSMQNAFVAAQCAAGHALDYRTYPGLDHGGVSAPDSPAVADAMTWIADRFAGEVPADTCPG